MTLSSDCYRANLQALREFQPEAARAVEAAALPDGVVEAVGRDGSRTFRVPDGAGCMRWFGRSSMPRLSAEAVVEGFPSRNQSAVIPGVLTGAEQVFLLEKLMPHTAVFVLWAEPVEISLSFRLYDYAAWIDGGRLVYVIGDHVADGLEAFFARHPGYEFPGTLLTAPQCTAADIARCQTALSNAAERVARVQSQAVQQVLEQWGAPDAGVPVDSPRVALLSVDPGESTFRQVRRIARALTGLAWPHAVCVPDHPSKCHVMARLRAVAEASADLALFINCGPGAAGGLIPHHVRVASWYLPGAVLPHDLSREFSSRHALFACSKPMLDNVIAARPAAKLIELLPVGADRDAFAPAEEADQHHDEPAAEIVVMADLPPTNPEAFNISLPSQVMLQRTLIDHLAENPDAYDDDRAEEHLHRAEQASGTALTDPRLGEQFLTMLRLCLAPAVQAQADVRGLLERGYRVGVWGRGWPLTPPPHDAGVKGWPGALHCGLRCQGPIPDEQQLARLCRRATLVLFPVSSEASVETALNALCTGVMVACRSRQEFFVREYPPLADLAGHLNLYQRTADLLAFARTTCSAQRSPRQPGVSSSPDRPAGPDMAGHQMSDRLRTLWARVRNVGPPATHNE